MKITNTTDYEKYQPIGDKVLLALPKEDVNDMENVGGVLVAKDFALKQTPLRETAVTAVGPECKQVEIGDTVLWNKNNGGQPFPFGNHDLYFLEEKYLICITKKAVKDGNGFPYPVAGAFDEGSS